MNFQGKEKAMFERKELQHIRDTAREEADIPGLNPSWRQVLLRLANAADHLDAMIARSTIKD